MKTPEEENEEKIGKQIARVLGLKPEREYSQEGNIRFFTTGGNKTYLDLKRTLEVILAGQYKE